MATAEYHREWRRRNPDKQEAIHRRYSENARRRSSELGTQPQAINRGGS